MKKLFLVMILGLMCLSPLEQVCAQTNKQGTTINEADLQTKIHKLAVLEKNGDSLSIATLRQDIVNCIETFTVLENPNSSKSYKLKNDTLNDSIQQLQLVVDQLSKQTDSLKARINQYQLDVQRLNQQIAESQAALDEQSKYILNYGNALLYRKYNANIEDMIVWLDNVSDKAKQEYTKSLLESARSMIYDSQVKDQDLKDKVWDMMSTLISRNDTVAMNDLGRIFRGIPQDRHYGFNLTDHAVALIDNVSQEVKDKDPENRYTIIRDLLTKYKDYNEEILRVLNGIQSDSKNSGANMSAHVKSGFINQIKNTKYYKELYSNSGWKIPFLNGIIEETIEYILRSPDNKKIDLTNIINKM